MGNRSYLYLVPVGGAYDGIEIAEANNNFPTLWQVLLAEGDAAPAITHQRVFADAGTDNLAADADAALERLQELAQGMREHPRLHEQPLLTLQFDALLAHLRELVEEVRGDGEGAVLFSANLDQLSWLDEAGDAHTFLRRVRRECDDLWLRVRDGIREGHYASVDEALGVKEHGHGFEHWDGWSWQFGFGGLHHDYFNQSDGPRDVPFAEFKPEPRSWENALGGRFERFERNGLWGVRCRNEDDTVAREVLAAEWEEVNRAAEGSVWLARGGLFGYALLRADGMRVDVAPQFEEVWEFRQNAEQGDPHCAVVRRAGREGLLGADAQWLVEPMFDEMWGYEYGYAPFRQGERQGFVDRTGRIAIAAEFDEVGNFTASGLAPAWRDGRAGLLRSDGQWALAPTYDDLEWEDVYRGFIARHDDLVGLVGADGSPWIEPRYDELKVVYRRIMIAVRKGEVWGVCDWAGRECLAPQYQVVEGLLSDSIALYDDEQYKLAMGQPEARHVLVRERQHVGVVDLDGKVQVPIVYEAVAAFDNFIVNSRLIKLPAHLYRITRRGPRRAKHVGVYDCARAQELVAPIWHGVELTPFGEADFGFLVTREVPKPDRERLGRELTGVLGPDGAVLFPAEYAWFGNHWALGGQGWGGYMLRAELFEAWGASRPIKACHAEASRLDWLHRDGRVEGQVEYLSRRYAEAGDLAAALELGRALRDGTGVPADAALARHWLWLATGAETAVEAAPSVWRQLFGKLLDGPAADGVIPDPQPSKRPRNHRAMYDLALMLQTENGGMEQPAAARRWLECALEHGGENDGEVLAELGYLLAEGVGGPADRPRGHAYYEKAIEHDSPIALHNLALAYQYGEDVERDLDRALEYFRRAERRGEPSCAYHVGAVLAEQARALEGTARRRKFSEAAYAFSNLIHSDVERHRHAACAEQARICLDRQTSEYDPGEAERLLLLGAEQDDLDCIDLLVDAVYGDPDSPRANAWPDRHRRARRAALQADDAA